MKRAFPLLSLALVFVCSAPAMRAQAADEAAIRAVITAQVTDWNRGDITAFMQSYEDSPDTTFIGSALLHKGFQPILQRYQMAYTSREQMGTLTFKDLEVRLLPGSCGQTEFAVVTGKFHLDRTAKGDAKQDDGIFSLVWHKGVHGWKIIVDHTS